MANSVVAFFMIHSRRAKEAFEKLSGAWEGILVSDNYAVYRKWVNAGQTCLSPLIRRAKVLTESPDPELLALGTWARKEAGRARKVPEPLYSHSKILATEVQRARKKMIRAAAKAA